MGNKQTHKVLVVDDEEPILELLKYNLEKNGYDVKTALDGVRALEIARKFFPDCTLTVRGSVLHRQRQALCAFACFP